MKLAMLADLPDVAFQHADPMPDLAAVHFQFCFAGPARSNSAAETGQVRSMSCQSRKLVFQLRKFNLKLAFFGARAPRKDIQNQAGAVDNLRLEGYFEIFR